VRLFGIDFAFQNIAAVWMDDPVLAQQYE